MRQKIWTFMFLAFCYWNREGAENMLHILYFNVKKLNILGNGPLLFIYFVEGGF